MPDFARLQWQWQPVAPLVTGYSQNLAEAAGEIQRGERNVVNLKTHASGGRLGPSFLATAVKGVFRTTAAWLIERIAREQGADRYVTCDYGLAVPAERRRWLVLRRDSGLCPVCQVFGGAGCLNDNKVAPAQRQQGRVRFAFTGADDAAHGSVTDSEHYHFTWEQVEDSGKPLVVQQLHFAPETVLDARIEPADDFALALLWLAGDLISSGFFRFGRFTTRGYGVVRLPPNAFIYQSLRDVLLKEVNLAEISEENGYGAAKMALSKDPLNAVSQQLTSWL